MQRRMRRGLSPLVSTIILISAAIIGGMFVYNYFQTSVNKITATSQSLSVNVKTIPTENGKLVFLSITNVGRDPVHLNKAVFLDANGTVMQGNSKILNSNLRPGGKNTFILNAPSDAVFVYIEYSTGETTLQTDPVQLS
jgi:archaellum component FlaF (FlaF/FlaG flagellin family)